MQSNLVGTVRVIISLDDKLNELKLILGNTPIQPKVLFDLVFRLWEMQFKHPDEYYDELFGKVAAELYESPLLKRQIAEANAINHHTLSPSEVADSILNITVGRVNAAVLLLDKPLSDTIRPIIDNYRASIDDVKMFRVPNGINFEVILSVTSKVEVSSRHLFSAYDSYRHQVILNQLN